MSSVSIRWASCLRGNRTCADKIAVAVELAPPGVPQTRCADLVKALIARDEPTRYVPLFMDPVDANDDPNSASRANKNQVVIRPNLEENFEIGLSS
jgi:hypothetical protein